MRMLPATVMLYKKRRSVVLNVQTKCYYVVVGEWGRLSCGVALEILLQISISSRGARQCKNPTDSLVRTSHHMPFGLDTPIDL